MSRRVLTWLFLVVFLVGSFAAPVRSSREGGRSVWAAGDATTASNDGMTGHGACRGVKKIWNRRSLGTRKTQPPPPVSNKMRSAAMPAPPSPTTV
ncbi:hypothetical protein HU200_015360 [Digitaria exilis]|uniref:Secreted protein n=1 Tax=Digitaria exilis TaxID=1010633 RepID=A0A835KKW0_9POAL|nr:hypothetical protein HU200_015360 [Digitaria exilis]